MEERLATLEERTKALPKLEEKLDAIHRDVGEIKLTLSKQRGFMAGVMAVIVPLWTFIVAAATAFWNKLTPT